MSENRPADGGMFPSLQAQATLRQRMNFAVQHLMAAARFSRHVGRIESENVGAPFGPFFDELLAYSSACVLSSVAALEAYANEFFADAPQNIPNVKRPVLEQLWRLIEREPILEKFDIALTFCGAARLDRNREPVQSVKVLIRVRNEFTHFKPEWLDDPDIHESLSKQLQGKFTPSVYRASNIPIFPMGMATHDCTKWVIQSCLGFAREFERLGGFVPKFEMFEDRLIP